MREHPILFSGPMVCAILGGEKTQTRRPVTKKPALDCLAAGFEPSFLTLPGNADLCPYGQPGDRLWVRETWAHYQTVNHRRCPDGRSFDEVSDGFAGYRADGHNTIEDFRNHIRLMSGYDLEAVLINGDRWRPSIHMPRWACRLVLEVVSVRVERVRDISEADCWAEGIAATDGMFDAATICSVAKLLGLGPEDARVHYAILWDHLNAVRGLGWGVNPWVWVVEFKRVGGSHA